MNIFLGIETSCDETGVAIVKDGKDIITNLIASQAEIHNQFGGVYPEVASRHHVHNLLPLIEKAIDKHRIEAIAVTAGPGLIGSLLMGITCAQTLAQTWKLPIVGVNHVEAHLYAAMMNNPQTFPALGIVLSGGHTFMVKMTDINTYEILGNTVDDSIGEAFDKIATLLDLPYPGGPHIEAIAKNGNPYAYPFKAGNVKTRPLDFSFSGLKTRVLYTVKGCSSKRTSPSIIQESDKQHIAASFQHAAFTDVIKKALKAAQSFDCQAIYCGGGVVQNMALKTYFQASPYPVYFPISELTGDNGAMIAGLGYHIYQKNKKSQTITAFPRHF